MVSPRDASSDPDSPPVLEAIELTKRDPGGFLALDAVSLAVRGGQIYFLVGAGGAGKTLLLHTLLGLVLPTAGRAVVAGVDVATDAISSRRHITYVARGAALYGSLTARENVQFLTRADGGGSNFCRNDYYNVMRRVSIPERHFESPARRLGPSASLAVWLAIGLLKDTSVLLFDEPTARLDLDATADFQESLNELKRAGKAILIATSDVLLAGAIADRVGILKEGRKRVELSRRELIGRSLPELYLEYMGRPLTHGRRSATR